MRGLSYRARLTTIFRGSPTIFRGFSTTFRVGRHAYRLSSYKLLSYPDAFSDSNLYHGVPPCRGKAVSLFRKDAGMILLA